MIILTSDLKLYVTEPLEAQKDWLRAEMAMLHASMTYTGLFSCLRYLTVLISYGWVLSHPCLQACLSCNYIACIGNIVIPNLIYPLQMARADAVWSSGSAGIIVDGQWPNN